MSEHRPAIAGFRAAPSPSSNVRHNLGGAGFCSCGRAFDLCDGDRPALLRRTDGRKSDFGCGNGRVNTADLWAEAEDLVNEEFKRMSVPLIRLGGELQPRVLRDGGFVTGGTFLGQPAWNSPLGAGRRVG